MALPDHTPLDFFLLSHLKSGMYQTCPRNINQLKERIVYECCNISQEILQQVKELCNYISEKYLQVDGEHFEHTI